MSGKDRKEKIQRKKIETSNEVRAFVYQKLHDFESYIKENTETEVLIEHVHVTATDEKYYLVNLTLTTENGDLTTIGEGDDIFDAVSDAARNLMSQISLIHNSVISTRERDLEIREAFRSQYLH